MPERPGTEVAGGTPPACLQRRKEKETSAVEERGPKADGSTRKEETGALCGGKKKKKQERPNHPRGPQVWRKGRKHVDAYQKLPRRVKRHPPARWGKRWGSPSEGKGFFCWGREPRHAVVREATAAPSNRSLLHARIKKEKKKSPKKNRDDNKLRSGRLSSWKLKKGGHREREKGGTYASKRRKEFQDETRRYRGKDVLKREKKKKKRTPLLYCNAAHHRGGRLWL